jgi:hypothetical protein
MVMKPTGKPASAASSAASRLPPSWASGLMVHCMMDSSGRRRISSRPPARTVAISRAAAISRPVTSVSVCTCLAQLFQMASSSWGPRVSAGLSWADTGGQTMAISSM